MLREKTFSCRAAFLILTLCGLYSVFFEPPFTWDFYNYHYYIGYAAINHRLGTDLALNMQMYFTPTLEAFNYYITTHLPQSLASFILGATSGIVYYLAYELFMIAFSQASLKRLRLFAALALIYSATSLTTFTQIGSWNGDQYTAIPILLSLLLFIKAQTYSTNSKHYFWFISAVGALVGIAAGLKLTVAFIGPAFLLIVMVAAIQHKQYHSVLGFILFGLLGFFASNGYWMWQLYHHFQNPFFPMFNNIFKSPYAELEGYRGTLSYIPKTAIQLIFFPFYWVINHRYFIDESSVRDAHLAIVFLFLIIGALTFLKRHGKPKTLSSQAYFILFFLTGFYTWAALFGIVRYLYPIQLLSGIILLLCLRHTFKKESTQLAVFILLTIIAIASCNYPKRLDFSIDAMKRAEYYPHVVFPRIEDNAIVTVFNTPRTNLIPFAPPTVQFVGIANPLNTATADNAMTDQIKQLIHTKNRPQYLLLSQYDLDNGARHRNLQKALQQHDIQTNFEKCTAFKDPFKVDKRRHTDFLLCPLSKSH